MLNVGHTLRINRHWCATYTILRSQNCQEVGKVVINELRPWADYAARQGSHVR